MPTANPFDLLVDDDNDDPSQLIAAAQAQAQAQAQLQPPPPAKKGSAQPAAAAAQPPVKQAKLPSKPLPPAQSVREARTEGGRGAPRGGGGRGGFGRGRGGGGYNREPVSNENAFGNNNGFSGGYRPSEEGDAGKTTEKRGNGGARPPFHGGRRGGFSNGEGVEGERPRREYERRSGTGRGSDLKRDGAGHGNWGTPTDDITPENEEPVNENEKTVAAEKQVVEEEDGDASKENPVTETEEKEPEPEDKEMTLEEYEKVLEEKRKALLALKSAERKVDLDKDLKSMQQLSNKKTNDDIFIKLGSEKNKSKEAADKEERAKKEIDGELDIKVKKYLRGEGANLEGLKDRKLKGQLALREGLYGKSAKAAAKAEKWLMPSEGGYLEAEGIEKTWRIKQEAIAREVDISSSKNQYDIVLPELGAYTLDYTPSGRYMAVAGRKGHLAVVDMKTMALIKELQVRETVRDVVFLHNELFFAAAQKKYSYIYNRDGTELHCLKEHGSVLKLQFLKNHFLLASINKFGQLHYQDVTTGGMLGNYRTGLGRTDVMQVNPFNGIVALGHSGGTVTMWKPTSSSPLIKMLCHHGPVSALAFHPNGHLMATAGMERKIKIWDLRKFEVLQTLPGHAKTLDFSQKGLLAMGTGSVVQVLRDFLGTQNYSRYMSHSMAKGYQVKKLSFRPYEDVLGIGHSMGWSSILIPGSGEPNFDSWVANPYETSKQRREKEVRSLLDKLPPETIMLDPTKIGAVRPAWKKEKLTKVQREAEMEAAVSAAKGISIKKKTKGRNKSSKRTKKQQEIVLKAKRPFLDQQREDQEELARKKQKTSNDTGLPKSLQRFARKKTT